MTWPICACCGRRAPHATAEQFRELTPSELALLETAREKQGDGQSLSPRERRLVNGRRWMEGHYMLMSRLLLATPRLYWGYAGGTFCTLTCALKFAHGAYRAGYRIQKGA